MSAEDTEIAEVPARPAVFDYARRKRTMIYLLLAYGGVIGAADSYLPDDDKAVDFLRGLPFLIFGIFWCFADAAQRRFRIGRMLRFFMITAFVIGFPVYIFRTRGIRGVKTIGIVILLVGAVIACFIVGNGITRFVSDMMQATRFNPQ